MTETVRAELVSRKEMHNDKLKFAEFKYTYYHDGKNHTESTLNIVVADYDFEAVWSIERSYVESTYCYLCKWEEIELESNENIFGNFTIIKSATGSDNGTFDGTFNKKLSLDYCRWVGSEISILIQIYREDKTIDSIVDVHDKLLQNNTGKSEVVIIIGDEEIPACKNILSAHSEVFAKMFDSDMMEKKTGRVEIIDVDPEIFELFLRFIHCGKLACSDVKELLELILVADKYSVRSLISICGYRISDNVNVENVIDIFITADQVKEKCLRDICVDFIIKNKSKLVDTESFKNMIKTNPDLIFELFCRV